MGALQPIHLMLVALVVLLIFGPKKLPELARGVGDSIKELQKSLRGGSEPEPAVSLMTSASVPPANCGGTPFTDGGSASTPPHLPS
jgi:sec-independent protein translocase protein TatA